MNKTLTLLAILAVGFAAFGCDPAPKEDAAPATPAPATPAK